MNGFPEFTAREHEVAAQECDVIAEYFEKLVGLVDGPLAAHLASQHAVSALTIRARAARHRMRAASGSGAL